MNNEMNYWLSPKGQVWESNDLGRHYEMALKIIDERYPKLLDEYALELGEKIYAGKDAVKDLEERGYIRYMGWGIRPSWVIHSRKPTKIQIRKMFELTGFIYR